MPESRDPSLPDPAAAPPATVPRSEAFRETFVFAFDRAEAQVIRSFGDLLQERMLDRAVYQERHPGGSHTLEEMVAVATDLWFLASFLRDVSAERRLSDLTPTEQSLAELAERLAPEVGTRGGRGGREAGAGGRAADRG